ncbi:MAG: septal ring lytic transglycosylase RlpA family protein [Solirubrobacterales bacterium]
MTFGERVTLRGAFPGASNAPIEILHRAKGAQGWEAVSSARTRSNGHYSTRVKPRRIGYWRAELASAPEQDPQTGAPAPASSAVDSGTGAERINVRSRTKTRIAGRHTRAGEAVKVRGKVSPAGAERRVVVEIGDADEVTTARRDGRFELDWRAPRPGVHPVAVGTRSNRVATGSRDTAGKVTIYRPATASWYGPGLYGNPMACGGTLTPSTMGVAHRTMPCGTKLRLRHRGRTVTARVVDRGPFAGNREFDLTSATKEALRFGDLGTVLTSK